MCESLSAMREGCHPFIFYHRVRPFLSAWKHNPTLPNGIIYEGVCTERQQVREGSSTGERGRKRKGSIEKSLLSLNQSPPTIRPVTSSHHNKSQSRYDDIIYVICYHPDSCKPLEPPIGPIYWNHDWVIIFVLFFSLPMFSSSMEDLQLKALCYLFLI